MFRCLVKIYHAKQHCRFCSRFFWNLHDIISHYNDVHGINKDSSPTFKSYIDAISRDLGEFFVEQCEYCTRPPFFDPRAKAEHYLRRHLKLLSVNKDKLIIRKIGEKCIEFSIDYARFGKVYNFKNLEKALNEFVDNVACVIPDASNEFCLVCCIVNQSAVESHGRRLFMNSCFTTGIIEGLMNDRVKEFLFLNPKKGSCQGSEWKQRSFL